jgi:hypothetical protein
MRSFSSPLCHFSHPEISGYGEAQLRISAVDLQRLARKVQQTTENPVLGRYVLDKILHNHREIAPAILDRPEIKVLFLLRNPEDTLRSILNMSHARGHKGKFSDPVRVLDYYVTRLQHLENYCTRLDGNAFFLESERLLGDTERVLVELSRWLELGEPLKADYRTFRFTGAPGHGDPSPTYGDRRPGRRSQAPALRADTHIRRPASARSHRPRIVPRRAREALHRLLTATAIAQTRAVLRTIRRPATIDPNFVEENAQWTNPKPIADPVFAARCS